MEYPSATLVGQKIGDDTFEIVSIVMACVAILTVAVRISVRRIKLSRFFIDDYFLMFGAVTLIGSTVITNFLLPYNQAEVDIGAGVIPPPENIVQILDYDVKYQDAYVFLTNIAIHCVKFSFLLFFKQLLEYTGKLRIYWWTVFIITIPSAVICACQEFVACPAFGENIMATCVYSGLERQTAILIAATVLDITTDVMLISIPVLILWGVRMNLRRKIGCGWLLCLSSFCVVCNIIRAVGHYLVNGQNDVVWILFWTDMEACVGLIACSMTAFRGLFNTNGSRVARLSPFAQVRRSPMDPNSPGGGIDQKPHVAMPVMTKPGLSALRSVLMWDPFDDKEENEQEIALAERGYGIEKVGENSFRAESVDSATETHRNRHEASTEGLRRK